MSRAPAKRTTPRRARQPGRALVVKKTSPLDRLLAKLPVSETALRRAVTWAVSGAGLALAGTAAVWLGVPAILGGWAAEATGRAGFRVEQVEITGLKRMDRMTVYAVALEEKSRQTPMAAVDLAGIRERLLRYGWIADAHVSRRLPDTLLVDIVERTPAAVWQDNGHLTLVDANGVLLEPVSPDAIPRLPRVIGPGADRQEAGYSALLAAAPSLARRVRAATWIGNRRWDLTFTSGEVLKLPEEGARQALQTFAAREGSAALLGRGFVSFDMRDPSRLVARKPGTTLVHQIEDDGTGQPEPAAAGTAHGTDTGV